MRGWTVERWSLMDDPNSTRLPPKKPELWHIALRVGMYPEAVFVTNPRTRDAFAAILDWEYPVYGHAAVPPGYIFRTSRDG